jgi:anti-sigma-K factor RskA
MENKEYIDSGILELYVYGLLSEAENDEITNRANNDPEINAEIIAIEKSIVSLSSSFSPFNSASNYDKIKNQLGLREEPKVVQLEPKRSISPYIGWAAAVVLLMGIVYQYTQFSAVTNQVVNTASEKAKLEKELNTLTLENKAIESSLAIIRDSNNTVVALGGQAVSPESFAKIYWNKETQKVYVDASGLPEPPEGMVYQVWSLKLSPLTPTSIGLLDNFVANNQRIFAVEGTSDAEAFGITLEPKGGSLTPTMEQLYTLGKV